MSIINLVYLLLIYKTILVVILHFFFVCIVAVVWECECLTYSKDPTHVRLGVKLPNVVYKFEEN